MTLGERHFTQVLCFDVRALSRPQVLRLGKICGLASDWATLRVVGRLEKAGLAISREVLARPLLDLREPLLTWTPEDGEPDYSALAWQLEKRWQSALEPTVIFQASDKARRIYGTHRSSSVKTQAQLSHDLHVSQVYLRCCERFAEEWLAWRLEDETEQEGKRTDASLETESIPELAIEIGAYRPERIRQIVCYARGKGIPLELW